MSDPLIELDNVSKSFGGIVAIDNISFSLKEGSITGLIGPNGAGKTTLFNIISGFQDADTGTIRLRGSNIRKLMSPDNQERSIRMLSSGIVTAGIVGSGALLLGLSNPVVGLVCFAGGGAGAAFPWGYQQYKQQYDKTISRPHQLTQNGLIRTFQMTRELNGMTVLENMLLGAQGQPRESLSNAVFHRASASRTESKIRKQAAELMSLLEIDHLSDEYAANLSGGQRKLLELGRVLMAEPDIILLDEPVSGINPTLADKLLARIRDLHQEGYTFFIIEHDLEVIMNLSEQMIVMNNGKKLAEGPPSAVKNDERVIDAYLTG